MNVTRLGWTLIHFLWQGAGIAALYAAVRWLARGMRTEGRYLLACVALASMMAAPIVTWCVLGQSEATPAFAADQTARAPGTIPSVATPLPPEVHAAVPTAHETPWLKWAVAIWLAGASALSLRLLGGWWMAARLRWRLTRPAPLEWCQAIERLRNRLGVARAVSLRVSAMVQSPVVIGAWRPLVLVPVGMLTGMPAAQVEALLIHELAHIRRHDYLVNLLQSIAEALLFYHPTVWWVSSHIRAEREHCCDDAAVAVSGDALEYANALAELAGSRPVRLAAIAANGGSLADRIARLLGEERPAPRNGLARGTVLGVVLLAATAYGLFAQDTAPVFQAASVKPNTTNPPNHMFRPLPGGRITARNATLQMLILTAYGVQPYQLSGGPVWMETDGFDIEASPDHEAGVKEALLMVQSLLADRFKLALHRETRQLPVYDLTAAKGSFNPPAPKQGGCASLDSGSPPPPGSIPCGMVRMGFSGVLNGNSVQMGNFVKALATVMGRPVIDRTSFTGALDIDMTFTPDSNTQGLPGGALGAAPPVPDPSRPSIFDVLQEQFGLKLISSKGPVEVLVIDHVERPTAN
jgi:uncharacterized protein (TIGR03435 family)